MDKEFYEYNNYLKMSEKEYLDKYGHLYEPNELISDKLKKYNIIAAQRDLQEKLPPYHYFLAKARKSFNNNLSVFKINNDVLEKIKNTTITKVPDEIPRLYNSPFIIETHDIDNNLFGDIDTIIGFYNDYEGLSKEDTSPIIRFNFLFHAKPNNDKIWYDTILHINKSILEKRESNRFLYLANSLFYLRPFENKGHWDFERIDYNRNVLIKNNYCDTCIYRSNCVAANNRNMQSKYLLCLDGLYDNLVSFITIFNYMLEAENSPIKTNREVEHTIYTINKKGKITEKKQDWIIKYIYLDKTKIKYEKNPETSELDKDSLIPKEIKVRGHLRHQAFGAEYKEHKWIYIESYVSTKWVKNGDTKIIVGLKK